MKPLLRFLEMLALGMWVGGIICLSFVVAPDAFRTLPPHAAGMLVGATLTRLHLLGYFCALMFLGVRGMGALLGPASSFATAQGSQSRAGALARPSVVAVLLMFIITIVSQQGVRPRMDAARAEMIATSGTVERTPQDSPMRAEFDRLHRISVALESAVLLLGLSAMYLAAREQRS